MSRRELKFYFGDKMKDTDSLSICQKCFDHIVDCGKDAILLYLDVCLRHFEGKSLYLYFEEDMPDLEELMFLEKNGYVVSADTQEPDLIKVIPKVRKYLRTHEYCCEKTKHFD